jgi:hypothetical protein
MSSELRLGRVGGEVARASRDDGLLRYRIYGLDLRSEIELSFPVPVRAQDPDIELFWAARDFFERATRGTYATPNPSRWYKYALLRNGQYYLRWDGLFEFLIDANGRRIWCGRLGATSLESLQVYLLGHALSFALVRQGFEPIHATCVVIDGQAIAILGRSGFGKSSLAATFLGAGHRLLTDDLLLLRPIVGGFEGQPGPPRIKLFPGMARRLLGVKAAGAPMNPLTKKQVLPLGSSQYEDRSVPLRALYVLSAPQEVRRTRHIRLSPLPARETFIELIRHTFNTLVTGSDRSQRLFLASLELASRVPARRLSYPRGLALLPQVKHTILDDLAEVVGSGRKEDS